MAKIDGKSVSDLIEETIGNYLGDPSTADAEATLSTVVPEEQRKNLEVILNDSRWSYRDGVIIQLAYAILYPGLDTTRRHSGARSVAQRLGRFFAQNHIVSVADAYQNIGKNSDNLVRGNFAAFDAFLTWTAQATTEQLNACFQYACSKVAETARPVLPMPEINVPNLSFAAVMGLFEEMLSTPSEGAHEQFIVASLLSALVDQNRLGYRVETKKINASDRSSRTAGDIQILTGNRIIEAFEVTANDWNTKLTGVSEKLREHDLSRIHVVATGVSDYASVARDLLKVPEDVSVLEIHGFIASLLAALTKTYRHEALRRLYEYLDRYQEQVDRVNAYVRLLQARNLAQETAQ